jgi:hypothetical protein
MEGKNQIILYKELKYVPLHTSHKTQMNIYWKLMININNLIYDLNYGFMSDLQTVFLGELIKNMNKTFHNYLKGSSSALNTIKRMKSNIMLYNDSIVFSHEPQIVKYIPRLYLVNNDVYKLGILDWKQRVKLYNPRLVYELL